MFSTPDVTELLESTWNSAYNTSVATVHFILNQMLDPDILFEMQIFHLW